VIFDTSFNLSSPQSQLFFMDACDTIAKQVCKVEACREGKLLKPGLKEPDCIVKEMLSYYRTHAPSAQSAATIPPELFLDVYKRFMTDSGPLIAANPIDSALSPEDQARVKARLLFEHQQKYKQMLGVLDNRIVFAAIAFRSSSSTELPNGKSHPLFDLLVDVKDSLSARAPAEIGSLYFTDLLTTSGGFTWMGVEDALVSNLFQGFMICFPVIWVVLLLVTGNVILAFYATFSIACIVICVLGAAKGYSGWDLGVAESISGVIVIGFSVDYTVHLGHMYKEATAVTREGRTTYAMTYMGGTVFGGAMTTLMAGLTLFGCTLQFFTKMATLLTWTIVLSLVYALFLFMPLCAVAGPAANFGNIWVAWNWLVQSVRGPGASRSA
jgi:hypothetical protein